MRTGGRFVDGSFGHLLGRANHALVRDFDGHLRPLFAAVHRDIVWKSAAPHDHLFRFGGVHQRRAGVMEVTGEIASEYIFNRFQPMEIAVNGDVVWGLFDAEVKYQPVGDKHVYPPLQLDIAIRWRIQDGKIIEWSDYYR